MLPKPEGWTIVVVGHWNRAILTPAWVGKEVFGESAVEVLLSPSPTAPVVYRAPSVEVQLFDDRLILHPRELTDEGLLAAEESCCKVLKALPHTPLTGVGVNFRFEERSPSDELLDMFNAPDAAVLFEQGWEISRRTLVRRLRRDANTLHLTLTLDEGDSRVDIQCNFHTDTEDAIAESTTKAADTAREAIDKRVLELRDTSLQLLRSVYHLKTVEEKIEV